MSKIQLTGTGIWIWEATQCEHGDWNAIVAQCKSAGIKWITAKSGDSSRYAAWTSTKLKEVIALCHSNDILFGTWHYSIPTTTQLQINQIKSLFDDGIDFHIIDAETEFEQIPNSNAQAEVFMQALRATVGNDVFIGHAPFAIPSYHPNFPYVGFGKYVDVVCPQYYWTEFNFTVQRTIQDADTSWAAFNVAHPEAAKPIYPIGVSYGKGYPGVPGVLNADDIKTFLNHYQGLPISFYSFDAAFPLFWETMTSLNIPAKVIAPSPPVAPQPTPEPLSAPAITIPQPSLVQAPAPTTTTSITNQISSILNQPGILTTIQNWIVKLVKLLFHIK